MAAILLFSIFVIVNYDQLVLSYVEKATSIYEVYIFTMYKLRVT